MNTAQIVAAFPKIAALVVGDVALERRCTYDPEMREASRETGIPRIGVVSTSLRPCGGGEVANHMVALNAYRIGMLGVVGDDGYGMELSRALEAGDISTEMMVKGAQVTTFARTRFINAQTGIEDLPRVDSVAMRPFPEEVERKLLTRLESAVGGYDVIVVIDEIETEGCGAITPAMRRLLRDVANRYSEKVFWASSRHHAEHFRKLIMMLDIEQAEETSRRLFGTVDYQKLRQHLESRLLMVDQGKPGVLVVEADHEMLADRPQAQEPSGGAPPDAPRARESFAAAAALALSVTGSPAQAARFGHLVAAVAVGKKGPGTVRLDEILAAESAMSRWA